MTQGTRGWSEAGALYCQLPTGQLPTAWSTAPGGTAGAAGAASIGSLSDPPPPPHPKTTKPHTASKCSMSRGCAGSASFPCAARVETLLHFHITDNAHTVWM